MEAPEGVWMGLFVVVRDGETGPALLATQDEGVLLAVSQAMSRALAARLGFNPSPGLEREPEQTGPRELPCG